MSGTVMGADQFKNTYLDKAMVVDKKDRGNINEGESQKITKQTKPEDIMKTVSQAEKEGSPVYVKDPNDPDPTVYLRVTIKNGKLTLSKTDDLKKPAKIGGKEGTATTNTYTENKTKTGIHAKRGAGADCVNYGDAIKQLEKDSPNCIVLKNFKALKEKYPDLKLENFFKVTKDGDGWNMELKTEPEMLSVGDKIRLNDGTVKTTSGLEGKYQLAKLDDESLGVVLKFTKDGHNYEVIVKDNPKEPGTFMSETKMDGEFVNYTDGISADEAIILKDAQELLKLVLPQIGTKIAGIDTTSLKDALNTYVKNSKFVSATDNRKLDLLPGEGKVSR